MSPDSPSPCRTPVFLGAIFLLWLAAYGSSLFRPALLDDADSVNAGITREMILRHDWVTLHVNGVRYFEKAPLLYWMMASSFKLFGVHDWSARLPLALGVLSLLYAVYFLGRRVFTETGGLYAAFATGFAFGPYIFTRFLIPDILVGLWFILSLAFFLRTVDEPEPPRFPCWGLAVACALNVLTKGLIGLVFPVAVIGLYLLLTRNLRHLLKMRLASSALVFLAIAAPWHILAGLRNPGQGAVRGFFWFYFVNEHFLRYLNTRVPRDYGTVPLVLFWGLTLVWLFPWTSFLPQALARVPLLRPREASGSPAGRARLVLFLAAFFVVFFFSFSTRQEYYAIPALPALALLVGSWLAEEELSPAGSAGWRLGTISSWILSVLSLVVCLGAVFLAVSSPAVSPSTDIADLLHTSPQSSEQYALSLGHFLDLNAHVMAMFRVPLLLFGLALLLGSMLSWRFRRRRHPTLANWSLAGMSVCLLAAVHIALITFSPVLTSKPLADAILRVYAPGDIIELYGEYEGGSTVSYYTGQQVRIFNGRSANLWYGSLFPDAPKIFDDTPAFHRLWTGPRRVFLWVELENEEKALEGIDPGTVFVLARYGGKLVLTNHQAVQ